jgi:hypothetical protein
MTLKIVGILVALMFASKAALAQAVILTLKYPNGTADTLKIRGYGDRRKFGGGKNSYFNQCLQGLAPHAGRQVPVPP